jgi:hypothetical protein
MGLTEEELNELEGMMNDKLENEPFHTEEQDIEALKVTYIEARRTFDQKIKSYRELSSKAERIVYIAVTTFALSTPLFTRFSEFVYLPLFGLGWLSLLISISGGIMAYRKHDIVHGLAGEDLERFLHENQSYEDWLVTLIRSYKQWIMAIERSNQERLRYVEISRGFLLLSFLLLGTGVFIRVNVIPLP